MLGLARPAIFACMIPPAVFLPKQKTVKRRSRCPTTSTCEELRDLEQRRSSPPPSQALANAESRGNPVDVKTRTDRQWMEPAPPSVWTSEEHSNFPDLIRDDGQGQSIHDARNGILRVPECGSRSERARHVRKCLTSNFLSEWSS